MKSAAIVVLILISADRVVRLENQRYALYNDMCKRDPANPSQRRCRPERHGFGISTTR